MNRKNTTPLLASLALAAVGAAAVGSALILSRYGLSSVLLVLNLAAPAALRAAIEAALIAAGILLAAVSELLHNSVQLSTLTPADHVLALFVIRASLGLALAAMLTKLTIKRLAR